MYTSKNFKSKKDLKNAVSRYMSIQHLPNKDKIDLSDPSNHCEPVTLFVPGLGTPVQNGWETVEGPHYPQPHRWYAQVEVKDGIVIKVK
jgi:hypothetical protein